MLLWHGMAGSPAILKPVQMQLPIEANFHDEWLPGAFKSLRRSGEVLDMLIAFLRLLASQSCKRTTSSSKILVYGEKLDHGQDSGFHFAHFSVTFGAQIRHLADRS